MSERHRFSCRDCGADAVVDGDVRGEILAGGCPLCGAPACEADFEPLDPEGADSRT